MLISDSKKFIFIAVPKTGTSSISAALEPVADIQRNSLVVNGSLYKVPEHIRAVELKAILGDQWDEFYKVGFVRNPWAKSVSAYHFYRNGRASSHVWIRERFKSKMLANVVLAKILPFKYWIRLHPLKSCSYYLCDESGKMLVNDFFKMEDLSDAFGRLCAKIEVDRMPLGISNRSNHRPYQDYFSKSLGIYVEQRFKEDIHRFGYSFE